MHALTASNRPRKGDMIPRVEHHLMIANPVRGIVAEYQLAHQTRSQRRFERRDGFPQHDIIPRIQLVPMLPTPRVPNGVRVPLALPAEIQKPAPKADRDGPEARELLHGGEQGRADDGAHVAGTGPHLEFNHGGIALDAGSREAGHEIGFHGAVCQHDVRV